MHIYRTLCIVGSPLRSPQDFGFTGVCILLCSPRTTLLQVFWILPCSTGFWVLLCSPQLLSLVQGWASILIDWLIDILQEGPHNTCGYYTTLQKALYDTIYIMYDSYIIHIVPWLIYYRKDSYIISYITLVYIISYISSIWYDIYNVWVYNVWITSYLDWYITGRTAQHARLLYNVTKSSTWRVRYM